MTDPVATPSILNAAVALIGSASLAVLGVEYFALFYGFVGALLALMQADTMPRLRAAAFIILSTLVGAVGGGAVGELMEAGTRVQRLLYLLCGAGALVLVNSVIQAGVTFIGEGARTLADRIKSKIGGRP